MISGIFATNKSRKLGHMMKITIECIAKGRNNSSGRGRLTGSAEDNLGIFEFLRYVAQVVVKHAYLQ